MYHLWGISAFWERWSLSLSCQKWTQRLECVSQAHGPSGDHPASGRYSNTCHTYNVGSCDQGYTCSLWLCEHAANCWSSCDLGKKSSVTAWGYLVVHDNMMSTPMTCTYIRCIDGFHSIFSLDNCRALHHHSALWLVNICITWHFCPPVSIYGGRCYGICLYGYVTIVGALSTVLIGVGMRQLR